MPKEEIQEQIEVSPIELSGSVYPDDLKYQVLDFSQKIINLTQNYADRVEALELAQEMAQAIKPFVDPNTRLDCNRTDEKRFHRGLLLRTRPALQTT